MSIIVSLASINVLPRTVTTYVKAEKLYLYKLSGGAATVDIGRRQKQTGIVITLCIFYKQFFQIYYFPNILQFRKNHLLVCFI